MRIFDLNMPLTEVGMYARVQCVCEGETIQGIVARLNETSLCFANDSEYLHGSNLFRSYEEWGFVTSEFPNGWVIRVSDCSSCKLNDILTPVGMDTCCDIELTGIFLEDGTIKSLDGCITTPRRTGFFHEEYERDTIYSGMEGYHSHHGCDFNEPKKGFPSTQHRIGVELEVEFNTPSLKQEFTRRNKSNWIYCERDGSLNDSTGVEIITIPMLPEHIKDVATWEPLIDYLSGKARSWDSSRCGLHVHIGREILGTTAEQQSETTGKLLYLYHHFLNGSTMNTKIFGRDRSYNEKDGKTKEGEAVATLGSQVFQLDGVKDKVKKGMIDKSSTDRYFDINLTNSATIEFRKGRGSIKASRITMVISYCEFMCEYAKSVKWEEISKENFVDYMKKSVSKDSPLYSHFEAGEACV